MFQVALMKISMWKVHSWKLGSMLYLAKKETFFFKIVV